MIEKSGTSSFGFDVGAGDDGAHVVVRVYPASPAERAALLPGDVLVRIGSQDIRTSPISTVTELIRSSGQRVVLEIESVALIAAMNGCRLGKVRGARIISHKFAISDDLCRMRWRSRSHSNGSSYYRVADIKEIRSDSIVPILNRCNVLQSRPQYCVVCAVI